MLDTICNPTERNDILYQWKTDEHLLRRNEFIGNLYTLAWESGVKTIYYVRSKALDPDECESCSA